MEWCEVFCGGQLEYSKDTALVKKLFLRMLVHVLRVLKHLPEGRRENNLGEVEGVVLDVLNGWKWSI